MAGPQPLTNPYAQQPTNLDQPVPDEAEEALRAALGSAPVSDINVDAPQGQAQGDEGLMALQQALGPAPMQEEAMAPEVPQDDFAPAPQGMEGKPIDAFSKTSIKEQIQEFWPRVQYAWAGNNREAARALKKSGRFDDVQIDKDGTVKVKRKGSNGYTSFDRDDFEIIGDLVDVSRIVAEGVTEAGIEAAGTAGLIAAAPATFGGSLIAQPIVGGVSAVSSLTMGDKIAESVFNIERDPNRSQKGELALAAGIGAGFNLGSAAIARRIANNKQIREQAEAGVEKVVSSVKQAASEQRVLEESGVVFDKSQGAYVITPSQATAGRVPELVVSEREMTKQPGFRNYVEQRGKELMDAYDTLTTTLNQKVMGRSTMGKEFKERFTDIGDYFGEGIGKFRQMAKDNIKQPYPVSNLDRTLKGLNEDVMQMPGKDINEKVMAYFDLDNPNQAKVIISQMNSLRKKAQSGAMPVSAIDQEYNFLVKQIKNISPKKMADTKARTLIKVKNALRDDYAQAIGEVVPPNQKGAYETFMKNYSIFKEGESELRNVLKQSDISKKALVSKLFENSTSLPKARALKVILDQEDPRMFRELTNEFFSQMRVNNTKGAQGQEVLNWAGVAKRWKGLGDEMQDLLLDGAGLTRQQMDSLLNLGQKYQGVSIDSIPQESKMGIMRRLWLLTPWAKSGGAAQANAATELATKIGKGDGFVKYLKEGGAEEFLKKHPTYSGAKKAKFLSWVDSLELPKPTPVQKAGAMGSLRSMQRQDMMNSDVQAQE